MTTEREQTALTTEGQSEKTTSQPLRLCAYIAADTLLTPELVERLESTFPDDARQHMAKSLGSTLLCSACRTPALVIATERIYYECRDPQSTSS